MEICGSFLCSNTASSRYYVYSQLCPQFVSYTRHPLLLLTLVIYPCPQTHSSESLLLTNLIRYFEYNSLVLSNETSLPPDMKHMLRPFLEPFRWVTKYLSGLSSPSLCQYYGGLVFIGTLRSENRKITHKILAWYRAPLHTYYNYVVCVRMLRCPIQNIAPGCNTPDN